jgi:hypothetical protein
VMAASPRRGQLLDLVRKLQHLVETLDHGT